MAASCCSHHHHRGIETEEPAAAAVVRVQAPAPPGAPVLEEGHKRLNVMSIIRTVVESSVTGTPLPRTLLPPPHPPQRSTATALP